VALTNQAVRPAWRLVQILRTLRGEERELRAPSPSESSRPYGSNTLISYAPRTVTSRARSLARPKHFEDVMKTRLVIEATGHPGGLDS
jgi:hypothetical protein